MTSETIERVRKAVNALDYIQHDWQQKDGRDTFNEQCEIIRAAFPAAPVKPGDVAEAVEALSRMIETAEKTLSLKEAEAKKGNDWVVSTCVHSSQHIIKLKPLITAAQQRPEVVTVEEFLKVAWSHVTYDHKPIEAIRQAAEDVQKRFPHGLIIKPGEG